MRSMMLVVILASTCLVGCGGTPTTKEPGETAAIEVAKPKVRTIEDLPPVENRLFPAIDEGRVEFSIPTGWKPLVPGKGFQMACSPDENPTSASPKITMACQAMIDVKGSTTEKNAASHAESLQKLLIAGKKKPIESCRPIILGERPWIRHVRKSEVLGATAAVQSLQTVKNGRLITIELTVPAEENPGDAQKPINYEDQLIAQRDFAYTLAAHLKFPKDKGNAKGDKSDKKEKK
jgi:hypothetical protein